jgi:hypothetical protein
MGDNLWPMAGYSGTPLAKKLGVNAGSNLAVLHAPAGFTIDDLPAGVVVGSRLGKRHDMIVAFVDERAHLERALPKLGQAVFPDGAIWVAWPKKASKVPTDMTEDTVRDVCLALGLVDVKVCAIDETWSGLKLVWRKSARAM